MNIISNYFQRYLKPFFWKRKEEFWGPLWLSWMLPKYRMSLKSYISTKKYIITQSSKTHLEATRAATFHSYRLQPFWRLCIQWEATQIHLVPWTLTSKVLSFELSPNDLTSAFFICRKGNNPLNIFNNAQTILPCHVCIKSSCPRAQFIRSACRI